MGLRRYKPFCSGNADDRFYFNKEIEENLNSALETGEVKTILSPGEFERFGVSGAEYNEAVVLNVKKYNAVSAMVDLPFGEMSNYIDQYPDTVEGKKIKDHLIDIKFDGSFRLNMSFFKFHRGFQMTSKKFHKLFGASPRKSESELTQFHMDLAASIQVVTEEIIIKLAKIHKNMN